MPAIRVVDCDGQPAGRAVPVAEREVTWDRVAVNRVVYREWLQKRNVPDTMQNRFRFMAFVSDQDAKKKKELNSI